MLRCCGFRALSSGFLVLLYRLYVTAYSTSTFEFGNCTPGSSVEAGSLEPVPLHDTAAIFAPASAQQDPSALAQIANTLSLYPLAIDGKNFNLLENVFFQDAVANFSAPINVVTPLTAIEKTIEAALATVTTQHQLGTQVIELLQGGCKARSLTYFIASHFGKNKYEGQVVYAYGQYQDILAKDKDGTWKIQVRDLLYMVSSISV